MNKQQFNRREFLTSVSALGSVGALSAASYTRVLGANDLLRIASVGVGGKGWSDLNEIAASPKVRPMALCDVDESEPFLGRAVQKFSSAKVYHDWRRLLDAPKDFDAVIVSTPDHMHAPIALPAMMLKKHVFCQKPLTHTVHEARQMRLAAAKFGVVTQMGNQIQSHSFYRTAVKAVHDGRIGKVKEVYSWQSGGMSWRLAEDQPQGSDPIPKTLHWDYWLGVAPERPYKAKLYHSFNWRGWVDFSNGQLGDFGCHILDPVFQALQLTAPTSIVAQAPPMNREVWPLQATVTYQFPGTRYTVDGGIRLTWYDGPGRFPPREALGLPMTVKLPGAGSVLLGDKGVMLIPHVAEPMVFALASTDPVPPLEKLPSLNHYTSWADACREEGKTTSSFDYAGPLTETVLLGTVAIRRPGERLLWDAGAGKITNSAEASALLTKPYRRGWEPKWIS